MIIYQNFFSGTYVLVYFRKNTHIKIVFNKFLIFVNLGLSISRKLIKISKNLILTFRFCIQKSIK